MTVRLAIVATHPIQYCAPVFRLLAARPELNVHVFYGWEGATRPVLDHGFGEQIQWDIPLLDGYDYTFVPNHSSDPGTHHFRGIQSSRLVPLVTSWQPDAVLLFGWNYESHLRALRALHGRVPILFRGDSTLMDERIGLRRMLRRQWLRWVYQHIDVALYVGSENRRYFEALGLHPDRLVWAPHSVANERFMEDARLREVEAFAWRRSLGIADDHCVVLFAGKFQHKKAPDLLLNSFLQRYANAPNVHLAFVGSGPLQAELTARAAGSDNVHFLGFQNQSRMPVVYRLGDIFVLPSRGPGETWGLAVNEAMASSRPTIVSTRVGCAPDLVEGEESGFVCAAGDSGALGDALDRLVSDAALRTRMGKAASRRIEDWSLESQTARIEAAVLACAGATVVQR